MTSTSSSAWLSRASAQARLGVGHRGLLRLVEMGHVGVRRYPGLRGQKFSAADIERIATEAVRPARASVVAC